MNSHQFGSVTVTIDKKYVKLSTKTGEKIIGIEEIENAILTTSDEVRALQFALQKK